MSTRTVYGHCHLCGRYGPLSFEHVPPKSAFNSDPVYARKFEEVLGEDYSVDTQPRGRKIQRGSGGYTLCGKCNNDTGAWYGNAYVNWAWQGRRFSAMSSVAPSIYLSFHIFPLRVLKQVVCMFFSVNHADFHKAQPELQRFVLCPERRILDPKIKIYAYHSISQRLRSTGIVGQMEFGTARKPKLFSEISFPPWGYLLCIDSPPPDRRLIDISFFGKYRYNDWKEISLNIPVLPVHTWIPGDYRSRSEVIEQMQRSKREGSES